MDPEVQKVIEDSISSLMFEVDDQKPDNNTNQIESNMPKLFKDIDTDTMFG